MAAIGHKRNPLPARLPPAESCVPSGCPTTLRPLPRQPPGSPPNRKFQLCSNKALTSLEVLVYHPSW